MSVLATRCETAAAWLFRTSASGMIAVGASPADDGSKGGAIGRTSRPGSALQAAASNTRTNTDRETRMKTSCVRTSQRTWPYIRANLAGGPPRRYRMGSTLISSTADEMGRAYALLNWPPVPASA
jgi:hypothetical protein